MSGCRMHVLISRLSPLRTLRVALADDQEVITLSLLASRLVAWMTDSCDGKLLACERRVPADHALR